MSGLSFNGNSKKEKSEKEVTKGFVLTFETSRGEIVDLEFIDSHFIEQVLRGLVHSGYTVTIAEGLVFVPDSLQNLREWEKKQYQGNGDFDQPPVAQGTMETVRR